MHCTAYCTVMTYVHCAHTALPNWNAQQTTMQCTIKHIYGFQCRSFRLLGFAGIIISILMPLLVYLWNSPHNFESKFIEDYDLQMWIQILWCPVNAVFLTFHWNVISIAVFANYKLHFWQTGDRSNLLSIPPLQLQWIKSQTNIMDLGQKYPILGMHKWHFRWNEIFWDHL